MSEELISPVVNSDRSVTFKFKSEHAKSVEAADEFRFEGRNFGPRMFAPSAPMKKTSDSIWIYKTKPLLPRIYRYFFIVDGIPTKER